MKWLRSRCKRVKDATSSNMLQIYAFSGELQNKKAPFSRFPAKNKKGRPPGLRLLEVAETSRQQVSGRPAGYLNFLQVLKVRGCDGSKRFIYVRCYVVAVTKVSIYSFFFCTTYNLTDSRRFLVLTGLSQFIISALTARRKGPLRTILLRCSSV